jgi:hypothetical protein
MPAPARTWRPENEQGKCKPRQAQLIAVAARQSMPPADDVGGGDLHGPAVDGIADTTFARPRHA